MFLFVNVSVVVCGPPYDLADCSKENNGEHYLSITNYTCPDGKRLEDGYTSVSVECMADGNWRDEPFYGSCSRKSVDKIR